MTVYLLIGGRVLARTWPPFARGLVTVDVAVALAQAIHEVYGVPAWVAEGVDA